MTLFWRDYAATISGVDKKEGSSPGGQDSLRSVNKLCNYAKGSKASLAVSRS